MLRRRSRKLPLILVAVAVLAGLAFALTRNGGRSLPLASPERGRAVEAVYATGTVEPESWSRIGPVATGRIAEVLVKEGDSVRQGQVLARLDDREARARVAELEARAAYWREELARTRTLTQRGIKAKEAEDKARSEYDQAVAAINAARQRRADLTVTSPLDGVVMRRDGEPGEVVKNEDALFWVGEPRPLRITADVDEEDIARVRPGQRVLVKADAFPDQVLEGRVDRITPKGDPINKTFRVRVGVPDDIPLLVGMTTEINIITAQKEDALLIPAGALRDGKVFVVRDGQARPTAVRVGIRGRDRVEILEGLDGNARLVASPPADLKAGDKVRAE